MIEWLFQLQNPLLIYGILFSLLLLGAIGFPMPEDLPLLFGGVYAHAGKLDLIQTMVVCYAGVVLGDFIIFAIGRKLGPSLFEKEWFKKKVKGHKMKRLRLKLEKRSLWMIFMARHLFYLRTVTFLICGAVKMRWSQFILADCAAAFISVPLMVLIGYKFAEQYETLVALMDEAKLWSILLAFPAAVIIYLLFFKKSKRDNGSKEEDANGKTSDSADRADL
jgi:membrane protein DedA with SNARE-associated domain